MTRLRQVRAIAVLTVLEAVRGRLLWLAVLVLLVGLALVELLGALAITETREVQGAILGSLLRLAAVVLTALFVISSGVRDFNDKVVEIYLSLPLPRWGYYLGKLAGFSLWAVAVAVLFAALPALIGRPDQALLWGLSLLAELLLMVGASLLCLFSFSQVTAALAAVAGFYTLSRAIGAIQLMAQGPFANPAELTDRAARWAVDGIAFILPDLYRFTPSEWLAYGNGTWAALSEIALQTLVYLVLLAGAGLFDLYRKDL
jgi:ABC-type transport system involved in multi-copper enzyme maturation permease subunit